MATWLGATRAEAFCGFYVTGADSSLYANATMVVLMRDGTRTVLSMQNNYQGPPEAFALVIPVPAVLSKEQVKTLPRDVFQHVDLLGAPRLVEYWELDPCAPAVERESGWAGSAAVASAADAGGVHVEAQFAVAEYDVVVLSANDSSGLETWLHDNQYNIPSGADKVLAPYVSGGMKFFVAKVDPMRVTFSKGQAVLSPLRFYYDTPDFSLPVRLGLLNSQGTQDLIVSILAPSRYEVANHPNTTIPTNIRVQDAVRDSFAGFYEALFSKVLEKHPSSVVTEYAWNAASCDPCPTPALSQTDLATLGSDVTKNAGADDFTGYVDYVLTRLHYRYTTETLGDDLVFKQAPPLVGGRGMPDRKGVLEPTQASPTVDVNGFNNFQGRYVILHPWEKRMMCLSPQRGSWGGPNSSDPFGAPSPMLQAASNTALTGAAPQPGDLPVLLAESISDLGVTAKSPRDPLVSATPAGAAAGSGGASGAAVGNKPPVTGSAGAAAQSASTSKPGAAGGGSLPVASGAPATADDAGASSPAARSSCSCQAVGQSQSQNQDASLRFGWLGLVALLGMARTMRRRT
jgi:hypothetical protein